MAKGLKIGDVVTVRKEQPVPKDEAAYQAGLTKVKPGQRGRIVRTATGRGFVVEFDSREVVLSSQALDIWQEPPAEIVTAKVVKPAKKDDFKRYNGAVRLGTEINNWLRINAGMMYSKRLLLDQKLFQSLRQMNHCV